MSKAVKTTELSADRWMRQEHSLSLPGRQDGSRSAPERFVLDQKRGITALDMDVSILVLASSPPLMCRAFRSGDGTPAFRARSCHLTRTRARSDQCWASGT